MPSFRCPGSPQSPNISLRTGGLPPCKRNRPDAWTRREGGALRGWNDRREHARECRVWASWGASRGACADPCVKTFRTTPIILPTIPPPPVLQKAANVHDKDWRPALKTHGRDGHTHLSYNPNTSHEKDLRVRVQNCSHVKAGPGGGGSGGENGL